MKKIAILGCDNSHANNFLEFIFNNEKYSDVEVVGVYSNEAAAAKALNEKYGVRILENYTEALGKIDGLIITARHGDLHYEYAKPYLDSGIPMFIDKPVTISEADATEFMNALKRRSVKVSGGSSLKHDYNVKLLKKEREENEGGATLGGFVRAPLNLDNIYGGFYFYAPHLVEIVLEVFGRYPVSVYAERNGKITSVRFRYDEFLVNGTFVNDNYVYYACRFSEKTVKGAELASTKENNWFEGEFDEFYSMLHGEESPSSYEDLFSSVYVMSAIERSLLCGTEQKVNYFS